MIVAGCIEFVRVAQYRGQIGPSVPVDEEEEDISRPYLASVDEFWIQKTPFTRGHLAAVRGERDGGDSELSLPVVHVSWSDACQIALHVQAVLTGEQQSLFAVDLPTEAEWEIAASAGRPEGYLESHLEEALDEGWFLDNSGGVLRGVGMRAANPLGVLDMVGDVCVWCLDAFAPYEPGSRANWLARSTRSDAGGLRAIRGSSYAVPVREIGARRVCSRKFMREKAAVAHVGMRLVLRAKSVVLNP